MGNIVTLRDYKVGDLWKIKTKNGTLWKVKILEILDLQIMVEDYFLASGAMNIFELRYVDIESAEKIESKIETAHDEENKSLRLEANQPMQIEFYCSTGRLGRFFINAEGKFDFEGSRTESAEAFIEDCKRLWFEEEPEPAMNYADRQKCVCGHFRGIHKFHGSAYPQIDSPFWTCAGNLNGVHCQCDKYRRVEQPEPKKSTDTLREMLEAGGNLELADKVFPKLFCANCGSPLAQSSSSVGFHCECPYRLGIKFQDLITNDPNAHTRRKQLKG